jgi:hypothetical protein
MDAYRRRAPSSRPRSSAARESFRLNPEVAPAFDARTLNRVTQELVKLHDSGRLSDRALQALIGATTATFVEQTITSKVDQALQRSFSRALTRRGV